MHSNLPEEIRFRKAVYICSLILIFFICLIGISFLSSCNAMPQFMQAADDVLTDNGISVQVYREAFKKETDVTIHVDIKNKDQPIPAK